MQPCTNCQFGFEGKFCPQCGQELYREDDKSIKNLLKDVFTSVYNLDGPVLRTITTIYRFPGKMSEDFNQGIRKRYFKPISLYFILVVLYLLFPIAQGLNVTLNNHLINPIAKEYTQNYVQQYMERNNMSKAELNQRFSNASASVSKFLLVLFIPFTVLFFKALYPLCKIYLYDLTIAALELNIFYLSFTFLLFPGFVVLLYFSTGLVLGEVLFTLIVSIPFLIWSIFFFKSFFNQSWLVTLLKSILFVILHFSFMVMIYRFIVFQTTLWVL